MSPGESTSASRHGEAHALRSFIGRKSLCKRPFRRSGERKIFGNQTAPTVFVNPLYGGLNSMALPRFILDGRHPDVNEEAKTASNKRVACLAGFLLAAFAIRRFRELSSGFRTVRIADRVRSRQPLATGGKRMPQFAAEYEYFRRFGSLEPCRDGPSQDTIGKEVSSACIAAGFCENKSRLKSRTRKRWGIWEDLWEDEDSWEDWCPRGSGRSSAKAEASRCRPWLNDANFA